ncbi:MAG: carbohydrate ABC transporter permease [Clostridiales bacterium]|nr:carbohydrate ABC transporter permease [Clostridiales bacterium]
MAEVVVKKHKRQMTKSRFFQGVELTILYAILIIMSLCFIVPFFWLISSSFKEPSELFQVPVRWFPKAIQFANYEKMFNTIPFWLYLGNTVNIVIWNIIGSLISCSLVAYGFSRLRWPGRDKVFILVLVTMILPFQVTMIPQFLMFQKLGWVGTPLPLTVTAFFGNPFYIFLLKQFFSVLPDELTQAARIDGAGEFRIFWQICIPLARPAMATVAIFSFMRCWNDYIGPLLYLSDNRQYKLSIGVQLIRSTLDPKWEVLMAAGVVMVMPVLVIFFLTQKYFIQGISMSGIKG